MTFEEREKIRLEKLHERFKFESTRMRGYELIYPSNNKIKNTQYEKLLQKSNDIWDEFTTGKLKHKQRLNEVMTKKVA
jgi:putative sterol carrier protein